MSVRLSLVAGLDSEGYERVIVTPAIGARRTHLALTCPYSKANSEWCKQLAGTGYAWRSASREWWLPAAPIVCRAVRDRFPAVRVDRDVSRFYREATEVLAGLDPESVGIRWTPDAGLGRAWLWAGLEHDALVRAGLIE